MNNIGHDISVYSFNLNSILLSGVISRNQFTNDDARTKPTLYLQIFNIILVQFWCESIVLNQ